MKYAVYRRGVEGVSLTAQLSLAKDYIANAGGCEELLDYCDTGVSAAKIPANGRPQLVRMLQDAEQRKFDVLLVLGMDRLARRVDEVATIQLDLQRSEVRVQCLHGGHRVRSKEHVSFHPER